MIKTMHSYNFKSGHSTAPNLPPFFGCVLKEEPGPRPPSDVVCSLFVSMLPNGTCLRVMPALMEQIVQ